MSIIKYNISKPKKYTSNGAEKTFWQNIGTMTEFHKEDGNVSRIIEIPAIGLEANIFPVVEKSETTNVAPKEKVQGRVQTNAEYPEEELGETPF